MRGLALFLLLAIAGTSSADELDLHRAAVLDKLIREIAPSDRTGVIFVRRMDRCEEPRRHEGCVDLSDEAMRWLRDRGHHVERVPEESRYYIYGHPSQHKDDFDPPPPDWLYLPVYTEKAEWRTYCEVTHRPGLYPDGAVHFNGYCTAAQADGKILVSGDFLVKREGEAFRVERFQPPPGCILPPPTQPDANR
jgi:hypothetical protein